MKETFQSYLIENAEELNNENEKSKPVVAKTLRDTSKAGICGTFSKEDITKNAEKSNLILGTNDIGFKYFVSKGATAESLMKMKYPVAKIRKEFNLQIEDFKDKKYSVND
jgi:hypothetical protein